MAINSSWESDGTVGVVATVGVEVTVFVVPMGGGAGVVAIGGIILGCG